MTRQAIRPIEVAPFIARAEAFISSSTCGFIEAQKRRVGEFLTDCRSHAYLSPSGFAAQWDATFWRIIRESAQMVEKSDSVVFESQEGLTTPVAESTFLEVMSATTSKAFRNAVARAVRSISTGYHE